MKLKSFSLIVGIVAIEFFCGCGAFNQAYSGHALPNEKVAEIKFDDATSKGYLFGALECDGYKIKSRSQFQTTLGIKLLPGNHEITFFAVALLGPLGFHEIARCNTNVTVEAGEKDLATGAMIVPPQVLESSIKPGVLSVNIVRTK